MGKFAEKQEKMPFSALRKLLRANDYTTQELAELLGKSRFYVCQRLNGKYPWSMDDVYAILDEMSVPYQDATHYFPKGGKPT